jgi:hypothetical protein
MRAVDGRLRIVRACQQDRCERDGGSARGRSLLLQAAGRDLLEVREAATLQPRWHRSAGVPGVQRRGANAVAAAG